MNNINVKNRTVFCRDNLEILQGINSNCIDLIYIDPPFNKKKVFTAPIGSSAEGASFKDWFKEEDVKNEWLLTIKEDNDKLCTFLESVKTIEGKTSYNFCYLSYMAIRIIELHRILKDTGSFYLHCDSTMSHYLKILLDIIFSENNFRNEIIWHYSDGTNPKKDFKRKHDCIYRYSKNNDYFFNEIKIEALNQKRYNKIEEETGRKYFEDTHHGRYKRYYLDDGRRLEDVWTYLQDDKFRQLNSQAKERVGYPTQKPLALLERIIKASSKEGDVVLDAFCGCATTCVASEKLNRQWIGIDVSVKAYDLVRERLKKEVQEHGQLNWLDYDKEIEYTHKIPIRTDDNREDKREKKYVYVISHPNYKGFYKVGIAKDYKARLNSYQTSDPLREYKLEYRIHTHLFRAIEKHIHNTFDNLLEWVHASKQDIIKEIENY